MMMSEMLLKGVFDRFKPSANSRGFKRLLQLPRGEKSGLVVFKLFQKIQQLTFYTLLITTYPQLILLLLMRVSKRYSSVVLSV